MNTHCQRERNARLKFLLTKLDVVWWKNLPSIFLSVINCGVNMAAKLPLVGRGNRDEVFPFLCCISGKQFLRIAVRFIADKLREEFHLGHVCANLDSISRCNF